MKNYVRADLSKQPLDVRLDLREQAQLAAQRMVNETRRALAEAGRQSMPHFLFVEEIFEGVTVIITVDGQAQQQSALLNQRIDAAIEGAVKRLKQKAQVKRGARKKEKSSIENEQWFWKTFASAVKKAKTKLEKGVLPTREQVAAEWRGKDGGCYPQNVSTLCRKYSFAEDGKHFDHALAEILG